MSTFNIWGPDSKAAWMAAWEASPTREPFAHPTFVDLFATGGQVPYLAEFQEADGGVLYPFIVRKLATEGWASDSAAIDLASPYGYGGPFAWGTSVGAAGDFWRRFDAWAAEQRAVASFTRLSLFEDAQPSLDGTPEELFSNVVRDLTSSMDEIWKEYAHKVRKNVKRAQSHDLRVEPDPDARYLKEFLAIYESTMTRREAAESFYFGEEFFSRIASEMRGAYCFFHVWHGDRIISTELVLQARDTLYSFLGGTLAEAFEMRPNDLLKHAVIEWGKAHGKHHFVLGGGYGSDDGIFRYKLAFAPKGVRNFRVLRRILDQAAYAELIALRISKQPGWAPSPDFFPAYRGG